MPAGYLCIISKSNSERFNNKKKSFSKGAQNTAISTFKAYPRERVVFWVFFSILLNEYVSK